MSRISLSTIAAMLLLLGGCATSAPSEPLPDLKPGERPDITTDEAGLWLQMDGVEKKLASSGRVVKNRALNEYIRGITCRLSPDYCPHLRLYIVQTPHFNASMAPNGTMQVWTGTLLRVENEAQLAYVLGHEMGHYIRRHSVQQWRSIRRKSSSMAFFTVTTNAAGLGFVGDLAELAALASVMAFSRDHERESDEIGLEMLRNAGYASSESPKIWENLIAENEAGADENRKKPSIFFSSHPAIEERIGTLKARTAAATGGRKGTRQFHRAIARYRGDWLRDEVRKRDYEGTEVLLDNLIATGYRTGETYFYKGELYRLREGDGDLKKAITFYRKAKRTKGAPAEVHRSLGLAYWKTKQNALARKSFRAYLAASPKAEDRSMVKSYLQQLR